jgi:hypothetical protein
MAEYDNTNRGQIWKNDKKTTDTQPDFTGSLNVDGIEFWVSAWRRKEGAAPNSPALSFSVKMKDDTKKSQSVNTHSQDKKPNEQKQGYGSIDEMESDIPF